MINVTHDYDQFKSVKGNRQVKEPHIQQVLNEIQKKGPKCHPIIVNEKMEVLDGQHRLEALKRLGLPVYFIVLEGGTIEDCISMNACQASWDLDDFITSFEDRGYGSYIKLREFMGKFPKLSISVLLSVISSHINGKLAWKRAQSAIKSGDFEFPFDKEAELSEELEYIQKFSIVREQNPHGRADIFYKAVAACYECSAIDNERLYKKLSDNPQKLVAYNTFKECLSAIQDVYNARNRNIVWLAHEVEVMLREAQHPQRNE